MSLFCVHDKMLYTSVSCMKAVFFYRAVCKCVEINEQVFQHASHFFNKRAHSIFAFIEKMRKNFHVYKKKNNLHLKHFTLPEYIILIYPGEDFPNLWDSMARNSRKVQEQHLRDLIICPGCIARHSSSPQASTSTMSEGRQDEPIDRKL